MQAWQATAQAYATCMNSEAKADQSAIVTGANDSIGKLSAVMKDLNAANEAAIAKLKGKKS